jgi:hypothetical protein
MDGGGGGGKTICLQGNMNFFKKQVVGNDNDTLNLN